MLKRIFDKITRGSLRFRWVTIALSTLLLAAGVFALTQFNLELIPPVEFPQSVVLAFYNAETPEEVLELVTIPIEDAVREVEGVVYVESNTSSGFAAIIISSEYGVDQEAIRDEIHAAVAELDFPEGMETPELLAFSLSDLPLAFVSASSSDLTLAELKILVEEEILPELEKIDGVARVGVGGGQELPSTDKDTAVAQVATQDPTATPEPTATPTEEPTATPTEEPTAKPTTTAEPTIAPTEEPAPPEEEVAAELEPVSLPDSWVQAAAAQGATLETTADLTPEVVDGIASFAPEMLDELTPEMLLAMPLEALAVLPQDYIDGLDEEIQAALLARLTPPAEQEIAELEPVSLPDSWVQAAAAQGATLETTADLTAEVVDAIASFAPQMLDELTPEMLLAMPLEALVVLPQDYLAGLDEETQTALADRVAAVQEESVKEGEAPAAESPPLPDSWLAMAEDAEMSLPIEFNTAADLQNNPFGMSVADLLNMLVASLPDDAATLMSDLTPEIMGWWAEQDPDFWSGLAPDTVALLSDEVMALVPAEVLAEPVAAEEELDESPPLPDSWLAMAEEIETPMPIEFNTAGDLQNNTLGMGVAELLNLMVSSGMLPDPAALLGDLTPEIMGWWAEQDPEFLTSLAPDTVELLSDDVLAIFPDEALAEMDAAAAEAEALAVESPPLPDSWTGEDSPFQTTADILNNPFGLSAGELFNMMVVQNPEAMGVLPPEVILWLAEQDEEFLSTLEAPALRLLSPEVLSELPASYMDTLEPDLKAELEGIAAGTIETFLPTETINRTNGQPSLALTFYKNSEANTVSVTHAAYDKLTELEAMHDGLRFDVAFEQASFIEESISGVSREGGLGALFAVLVILLFLSGHVNGRYTLSWRSTLVTGVSIPLSVMMGFAFMRWIPPAGHALLLPLAESVGDMAIIGPIVDFLLVLFPASITLNIMTLSGMTVAVGRVVDDSIVVLENIYRHIQRGKDPRRSVIDGTRDVAIPIFASTVTTVVVFLPVGLMGGMVGNFFLPFGMTVTYALGSSFIVAITIVPVLAYLFIRKEHLPTEKESSLQRAYTPVLKLALRHRFLTLFVAAAIFLGSMWLLAERPRAFLPDMGEPSLNVYVDMPNGATMVETAALVVELEAYLDDLEGIDVYQSEVGSAGGMEAAMFASGIDQGVANLTIAPESMDDIDRLTAEVRTGAEAIFGPSHVTISVGGLTAGGMSGVDLVLAGDPDALAEIDGQVLASLQKVDGLVNVTSNLASGDAIVRVDGQPAARYSGEIEGEDSMGVLAAAKAAIENMDELSAGMTVSEGFSSQMQTEGFAQTVQALIISIVVVYLVMVVTFNSLTHPFVILFSLPLAVIGAALGLWITDRVVGISAMVGLMMLVGIVVTNAIILIDRVRINRKERDMGIYDALVEAGRTRLRPILMTATAAILALVPLGLGLTEGALIASELATVVIGGLFVSTLLTLLVVPVVYSLLESALRRLPGRK